MTANSSYLISLLVLYQESNPHGFKLSQGAFHLLSNTVLAGKALLKTSMMMAKKMYNTAFMYSVAETVSYIALGM